MTKPSSCTGCALETRGRGFTSVEGQGTIPLIVIGEASGENEANDSLPFRPYAQAGSILERAILGMRITRNDLTVTNCIRCQPPNNILEGADYKIPALSHCSPNLTAAITASGAKAILALGGIALETLTGLHGKKRNISSLRGYVLWSERFKLPVIATYHPAFLARGQKELLGIFYSDLIKAIKLAKGELRDGSDYYLDPIKRYPNNYDLAPKHGAGRDLVDWCVANPHMPIGFDIETEESAGEVSEDNIKGTVTRITQFQVSKGKGHALVLTNNNEHFFYDVQKFMSLPNPKLGWNSWRFDQPVLEANGVKIAEPHYDLMTMYHHWNPDIPAGLQYAAGLFGFTHPWKHLAGDNLEWYGATDVDVLHWIYEPLLAQMRKEGVLGW